MKTKIISIFAVISLISIAFAEEKLDEFAWSKLSRKAQKWDPVINKDAEKETIRVRVVDFGQANCRWNNKVSYNQRTFNTKEGSYTNIRNIDLDNNPKTIDWIQHIPFSLKRGKNIPQMSPRVPQWDVSWDSAIFYGGLSFMYSNRSKNGLTEAYTNTVEGDELMKPGSNWAIHAQHKVKGSSMRGYYAPVWRKEEFPHLGSKYSVTFDENSKIGLYTQRYWTGYEGARFLIKDSGQLYLSEVLPDNWNKGFGGSGPNDLRILYPTKNKWTKWELKAGDWDLKLKNRDFKEVEFKDVQAIGFYIFKDSFTEKEVASKWECFEAYANVTRPKIPSETIDMKKIDNFYISTCETPYEVWKRIFRMSRTIGQFVFDEEPGMIYDRFGNMGSQQYGLKTHSQAEPVTNITLYDIIAWCNAISEYEGREFVYYTTPDFQKGTEFRNVLDTPYRKYSISDAKKTVYVKWDSDGFRLPTPNEWLKANNNNLTINSKNSWIKENSSSQTQAVGSKLANENGLYDMTGNVWETLWTYGDKMPPKFDSISVVGGDFNYPDKSMSNSASSYGDMPFKGSYNIGFRLIRRDKGEAKPDLSFNSEDFKGLIWNIKKGDKTATAKKMEINIPLVEIPKGKLFKGKYQVEMTAFKMGSHEISYKQWKSVFDWAIENGYEFDSDGDMGSMDYRLYTVDDYSPDEPVADISSFDMLAWCNALSEINNLTPVFYSDKEKTKVYKKVFRYRQSQLMNRNYTKELKAKVYGWGNIPNKKCYIKWDANGYRLPTIHEWVYTYNPDKKRYPWGDNFEGVNEHGWWYGNAKSRTHKVGLKKPNSFGLYDMMGNVVELTMDSVGKGSKIQRGQTQNPVFTTNAFDSYNAKTRVTFQRNGFLHFNKNKTFGGDPTKLTIGSYSATHAGWYWSDCGFRIVKRNTDDYPPMGYDPSKKPTPYTKININRIPGEK